MIFPLFRSRQHLGEVLEPRLRRRGRRPRADLDEDKRLEHYREAFEILGEDVPGIGLYQDFAIYAARKELQWKPTAERGLLRDGHEVAAVADAAAAAMAALSHER